MAIYSQYDLANKLFYPLGMMSGFDPIVFDRPLSLVSTDRFGSIGANGAQGLDGASSQSIAMLPLDQQYSWDNLDGVRCISVDGGDFIKQGDFPQGAHNDIFHPEIFHLALAISLR